MTESNKHPNFKQPNPRLQMLAILSALRGQISNASEQIISSTQLETNTDPLFDQLQTLAEFLPDEW